MSATRIWSKFKELLDVSWGTVSDGYLLKRSGTNIIGVPTSDVGQTWRGEYDPATTYQPNDAVSYSGSSYRCGVTTVGVAPVPSTASYLIPPLATTGSMGSIAALPVGNQTQYFARGDNTWQTGGVVGVAPVGAVIDFAGSVEPDGWIFCYGQSLLRTGTMANLFAAIGTAFGSVDGTHFNAPDLRGYVIAGRENMGGVYPNNRLSVPYVCNTTSGNTTVTIPGGYGNDIFLGQFVSGPGIPATATCGGRTAATTILVSPAPTATATGVTLRFLAYDPTTLVGGRMAHALLTAELPSHTHPLNNILIASSGMQGGANFNTVGGGSTLASGADYPHNNVQPTTVLNKIIKY